jgi:arylformamidase
MKILDISLTLFSRMTVWPGDQPFAVERMKEIVSGDEVNLTRLIMTAHAGTHVDAPLHFSPSGKGAESLDLETLCGEVFVVHLPGIKQVRSADLAGAPIPASASRLLFRTDNSRYLADGKFHTDFVALSVDAAEWIADRDIKLVGIDYLSIGPYDNPAEVHKILLEKEIAIVEGLDLRAVTEGRYLLFCLPLKIAGGDGAPARAVLVRPE